MAERIEFADSYIEYEFSPVSMKLIPEKKLYNEFIKAIKTEFAPNEESEDPSALQLIVDEPPGPMCAQWIRSRVEWYKRIAPHAPLTDEKPNLDLPAKNRIRCSATVSEALWAVVLAGTWQNFPFAMLMSLAALQMVPASPLEAARIDGASAWQVFLHVRLPFIAPTLVVAGLFMLIDSVKAFPLIFIMTDGGPGNVTEVTNYYVYRQAFSFSLWGYASSIAITLVAAVFLLSYAIDRLTSRLDKTQGSLS
jgi:hypothetical protein